MAFFSDQIHTEKGWDELFSQLPDTDSRFKHEQHEIVSRVAYLIGVPKFVFEKEYEPLKLEIYEMLDKEKKARIVRNLCALRTQLEITFLKVCHAIQREGRSIMAVPELLPTKYFQELDHDGVPIYVFRICRSI